MPSLATVITIIAAIPFVLGFVTTSLQRRLSGPLRSELGIYDLRIINPSPRSWRIVDPPAN